MGGGTLRIQGKSGAFPSSQTLASLTLTAGTASSIVLTPNGGTSTTLTITGTAASTGGALNFNYSAGTTNGATVGNDIVVWNPSLTNGIIGGGYTVTDAGGAGYATVSGNNVIRLTDPGNAGLPFSGGAAGSNYFVNSSYSTSVTSTPGSLVEAISGAVAANTVTVDTTNLTSGANLALGANTLTLSTGGGMVFGGPNPYTITATAGGGITTSAAAGSTTFANFNSSTVTISAPILNNSASTVTFAGSGTTILTGANTYTGTTRVGGGTVQFGDGTSTNGTLPGAASVGSGATLAFNYSGAVTYAGSITGALGSTLVKAGSGTLSFTNSSASFAGQININANGSSSGALAVGQNNGGAGGDNITYSGSTTNPLGTGAINVAAGAALQLNAGGLTISNNITLNGTTYGTDPDTGQTTNNSGVWNGALMGDALGGANTNTLTGTLTLAATSNISTNWSDKTLSITGQITGPGGLIIDNSAPGNRQGGVFKLSNSSNNYQGDTTIVGSGGNGDPAPILLAGAANVIPGGALAGNVIVNGTLNMAGFSQSINGLSGGGTIDGASGTPTLTIGNNNGAGTFTGVIENSSGTLALTKVGTGIISLTATNTYAGATTIGGGTLSVGTFTTNNASGGTSTSLGTGPVSVAAGATLALSNTGLNIANNITLNGMTPNGALVGGVANNPQANTLSGTLTLAATSNLTTVWNDKTLTITGQVTGPGGLIVDNYSTGTQPGGVIVLSNPTNNYQGDTTINANKNGFANPILQAGAAGVVPSTGNLNVNGQLDLNHFSQSVGALNGIGTVDSSTAGTPTLTIGSNNASGNFAGVIQNSSGTVSLTKAGSGVQVLSNANTYSGATNITGGTLRLAVQLPSNLPTSNLQTWFDATDSQTLTVSGGKVTSVANRAGVDSATQANSANQPTLNASNAAFNGLPTLTFSGNQHLNGFDTSYLNGSSYTIFTVSAVNAGGNQYILGSNSGGTNTSLHFGYRDSATFTLAQFNNDLDYSPTTPVQSYNGSSEVAMDWSGKLDTASGHAIYFNGGSSVASNGNTDALISQTTTSGILGAGFNNSAPFNGDVGEVLIFNTALSDAQRAAVEAYLQTKWGISGASSWASTVLPSNTPVTISGGGILNLNGGNQTIGSLASSDATTQVQLGAGTLTTGNDGTSTSFAGSITGSGG